MELNQQNQGINNRSPLPMMQPVEAIKKVLQTPTDFAGRSRRSEFWWFLLFSYVLQQLVGLALNAVGPKTALGGQLAVMIALVLPTVAVQVRRLHDIGRGAWWAWVFLVINIVMYATILPIMEDVAPLMSDPTNQAVAKKLLKEHGTLIVGMSASGFGYMIWGLIMLIFNLMDSDAGVNRYGNSPKYPA